MMYHEFLAMVKIPGSDAAYEIFQLIERLYMISDTMSKQDVCKFFNKHFKPQWTKLEQQKGDKIVDDIRQDPETYLRLSENSLPVKFRTFVQRLIKGTVAASKGYTVEDKRIGFKMEIISSDVSITNNRIYEIEFSGLKESTHVLLYC